MNRREFLVAASATPFALAASPVPLAGLAGGTPLALVTADLEERIVALRLPGGRRYREIPTLPGPRSIEGVLGTWAIVAHTTEGAVSIVDGRTLRVRRVLRSFTEPRYTAVAPKGDLAYMTDSAREEVVVIDIARGRVLHRTDVGGPARHVSIDRTGRRLWTSLGSRAQELAILDLADPSRPRLLRRVRPPFLAHDVGFTPDGSRAWVTSGDRHALAVYDAGRSRMLRQLPAGAPPQHVTFLGETAYVTSGDDGSLAVRAAADGRLRRSTTIPIGSYNVQQGFGLVLTPSLDRGTLCVADRRGTLIAEVQAARSSHDACFVMSL